jgi:hypothetical protein
MEQQIIPNEVFCQPTGEQPGLRSEYFSDANFARKVGDRIDESIEFIWDRDAVFNGYYELKKQIVQSLLPRLAHAAFLTEISEGDLAELAHGFAPLLAATTASERSALLKTFSSQPRLLKEVSHKVLADQIPTVFMLPESLHLDFIIRWSEANEVPSFEPGTIISGRGTYVTNNIDPYWCIGQCLGESQTQKLYDTIDRHLQNKDGSCNLGLTYVVVSACREYNRLGHVLNRIDEALADTELSGDAKASWYLAKAFALETAMQPTVKPARGIPELREALGEAESGEYRSRIQRELVARFLTLGHDDEVKSVLSVQQGQAMVSEGQPIHGNDIVSTSGFREQYAAAALRRQTLSNQHYIDSVKKQQELARLNNDADQVARLQKILSDFDSKHQPEKK